MTDGPETQGVPLQGPSMAVVRAATEIAGKISVVPVYSRALGESFAEIIERHTHSRELLVACKLARDALSALDASTDVAQRQREMAIAALDMVIAAVE
jgi:hypothetical protein